MTPETSVTLAPSPTPVAQPTVASPVEIVPQEPPPLTSEQRWRAIQSDRVEFDPPRTYVASTRVSLLWYDAATGLSLEIGTLSGAFPAQAAFVFLPENVPALEVSYMIDQDFGLTSISSVLKDRMQAAGYSERVDAFVVQTDSVQPQAE